MDSKLKKNDIVYYAKVLPSVGVYEICELKIRTIEESYFVGVDKRDKHAYLFGYNNINKTIFSDRKVALKIVQEAEKKKSKIISDEIYYEEY